MAFSLSIKDIEKIFDAVQRAEIFADQKTMTDAIPRIEIRMINALYEENHSKSDFDLKAFVEEYFDFPHSLEYRNGNPTDTIDQHIEKLWDHLTKEANQNQGTLLQLPKRYIVPGGRFNEFFYWDSYFVMLGLKESNRIDLMENIVENCAYLISTVGFVPNASRTHFLTRSQPPYFSLMVELLAEAKKDNHILGQYQEALEKEYQFWMKGEDEVKEGEAIERVVKLAKGEILNRYYDQENTPRPESYKMDIKDQASSSNSEFYRNIRAACESGWDFSSRWFADLKHIQTIETTAILPVDLNALLWNLENLLGQIALQKQDSTKNKFYTERANARKHAIQNYFWNETQGYYTDYNFIKQDATLSQHMGMLYPLFFQLANKEQVKKVENFLLENFLYPGGLVTTTKNSGQQWDFPNAWAPFQWLGYEAMKRNGCEETAQKIAFAWTLNVEKIFNQTRRLMEKYNAVDMDLIAGGGEYPNQDGFGWTNGVYTYLKNNN